MMKKKYSVEDIDWMLADTRRLIDETTAYLISKGVDVSDLADWLSVEHYCERFGIENTEIVYGWIDSGIVPAKNIRLIKEMNNLPLIKALPYHAIQTAGS